VAPDLLKVTGGAESAAAKEAPVDNTMLIAMQTQRVLQRRLDVAAGNLANAATSGFKRDSLVFQMIDDTKARASDKPNDVRFVRDVAMARDMGQGPLERTGNSLDIAIQGDGFFTVQGAQGTLYTRDGTFRLGADGALLTRDGLPVLNVQGQPIVFDPQGEIPSIDALGTLRVNGEVIGDIAVVAFERPAALAKVGDNLFSSEGQPTRAFTGEVVQGALEGSNVRPVTELTSLIEISRAYESAARVARQADDLRSRAIERLGRA
jgi:flagellar basal-body rod protein FlgF